MISVALYVLVCTAGTAALILNGQGHWVLLYVLAVTACYLGIIIHVLWEQEGGMQGWREARERARRLRGQ